MKIPVFKTDDKIKLLFPFKHVMPVVTIDLSRADYLTHIDVFSPRSISVHESFIMLNALHQLLQKVINKQDIPDELELKSKILEKNVMADINTGYGTILTLKEWDDDDCETWANRIFVNDNVKIMFWYKVGFGLYYGKLFVAAIKFKRPISEHELWNYLHLIMFVIHQVCNGRYTGGGEFNKTESLTIIGNIEIPFEPAAVLGILKTLNTCYESEWFGWDNYEDEDDDTDNDEQNNTDNGGRYGCS